MDEGESFNRVLTRATSTAPPAGKGSRGRLRTQDKEHLLASLKSLLDSDKDHDNSASAGQAPPTTSSDVGELSACTPLLPPLPASVAVEWPELGESYAFDAFSAIDFSGTAFSEPSSDLITGLASVDFLDGSEAANAHINWPDLLAPSRMGLQQHNNRQATSSEIPGHVTEALGGTEWSVIGPLVSATGAPRSHDTEIERSAIQQQKQLHNASSYSKLDPSSSAPADSSEQYPKYVPTRMTNRRTQPEGAGTGSGSRAGDSRPKIDRAHSLIERRYRAGLQHKFQMLRDCVARWKQTESDSDPGEPDEDASPLKMNKASVLTEAVTCISHLEEENEYLYTELEAVIDYVQVVKKRNLAGGSGGSKRKRRQQQ